MTRRRFTNDEIHIIEDEVNLDEAISNTTGKAIDTDIYNEKSFYIVVSENTGAVTINVEYSPNNISWFTLFTTTYTATNSNNHLSTKNHFSYMRTTTTSQSNSTVKTLFSGRS